MTVALSRRRTKADIRREQQRKLFFSEVPEGDLWSRAFNGWCWVPRTMPLILHSIRSLSKGVSAAETYHALWCHCVSESIVEMSNIKGLIAASGYTGATSERTWRERIKKLAELGFIKIASGKYGEISCVLLLNPHKVLRRHKEARTPGFDEQTYNCILGEIADYGMRDFEPATPKEETEDEEPPEKVQISPPPVLKPSRPVVAVKKRN